MGREKLERLNTNDKNDKTGIARLTELKRRELEIREKEVSLREEELKLRKRAEALGLPPEIPAMVEVPEEMMMETPLVPPRPKVAQVTTQQQR